MAQTHTKLSTTRSAQKQRVRKRRQKKIAKIFRFISVALCVLFLTAYLHGMTTIEHKTLPSILTLVAIPMFVGLQLEVQRSLRIPLRGVVKRTVYATVWSYILIFYIAGRLENTAGTTPVYAVLLQYSPILIVCMFALLILIEAWGKFRLELTEGTLLLQALVLSYFLYTVRLFENIHALKLLGCVFLAIFVLYILLHAFSSRVLSRQGKLIVSIVSSCTTLMLSILYVVRYAVEVSDSINQPSLNIMALPAVYIVAKSFIFGICLMYIMKNIGMIFGYLPDKGESMRAYKVRLGTLSSEHIERISNYQLPRTDALLCIVLSGALFASSSVYHVVSPDFAIVTALFAIPLILNIKTSLANKL